MQFVQSNVQEQNGVSLALLMQYDIPGAGFKQTDAACMPVAASVLTELFRTAKRLALALVADGPDHVPRELEFPARDIALSGIALKQSNAGRVPSAASELTELFAWPCGAAQGHDGLVLAQTNVEPAGGSPRFVSLLMTQALSRAMRCACRRRRAS